MMIMHCKLFSFNRIVVSDCCFLLNAIIILYCSAGVNGDTNSTASSCSSSSMECANLGNISYPFWGSAACAASPSYVLPNCSTSSSTDVYWDAFSSAATGVIGPPAVTAVAGTSIQLSWNKSLIELGYCAPLFSSKNVSLYNIPSSINLTRFDSDSSKSALEFSPNNTFLLFNCTQYSNASNVVAQLGSQNFVTESASGCVPYKGLCSSLAKMPCIQWSVPQSLKALMLQQVLDSLSCAHFMLGIASHNELGLIDEWSTGSIELMWRDLQCKRCEEAFGLCSNDLVFPDKFGQCTCSNGIALDLDTQTNCNSIIGCDGGSLRCNAGVKAGFGLALIIIAVLGVILAIKYRSQLHEIFGMTRKKIRDGFSSFINVTIPIAINLLKGAVRKLQLVGPHNSLDLMDFDGLTERPTEYSYSTISSATKSFTSLVGEGGFSSVYKGTLTQANSHGGSELQQIAVKVLDVKSKHSKTQFLNEVITIGRIHHVNVVRLLGFCTQADHEILVYEYVTNQSLDSWLFVEKANATDKLVLDWGKRYAIALGVARGLSYLHEECRHRTVHCDIKPQNILLDEDMHPKIADFGLARLMGRDESKVITFAKGTPGYMAPEFWMGGESQLSTKFDVYSYGMVLLELISGRRNFRHDTMLDSSSSFPAMAFKAVMKGDLQSILDSRLSISTIDGDEAQMQEQWSQIKTAVLVALWCIQDHPTSRPCMSEVVKYLDGGAAVPECPPQPHISTFYGSSSTPRQESSSDNYENDISTALSVGR